MIANGGATNFKPGWAILRYMGANHTDPTTSTAPLLETDLHPFEKTAVPGKPVAGGADITMNLVISFNNASKSTPFEINGAVGCLLVQTHFS
jgi:iron transport multicopper oxidase